MGSNYSTPSQSPYITSNTNNYSSSNSYNNNNYSNYNNNNVYRGKMQPKCNKQIALPRSQKF